MLIYVSYKQEIKVNEHKVLQYLQNDKYRETGDVILFDNCHLFLYSRDCVIKLSKIRIFKALLRIKKSFKSIDFDLAKHTFSLHWLS